MFDAISIGIMPWTQNKLLFHVIQVPGIQKNISNVTFLSLSLSLSLSLAYLQNFRRSYEESAINLFCIIPIKWKLYIYRIWRKGKDLAMTVRVKGL